MFTPWERPLRRRTAVAGSKVKPSDNLRQRRHGVFERGKNLLRSGPSSPGVRCLRRRRLPYLAVLGLALAAGRLKAGRRGRQYAAGIVVGKIGTATVSPKKLPTLQPPDDAPAPSTTVAELTVASELKSRAKNSFCPTDALLCCCRSYRLFQASRKRAISWW
jgi:hypothetical protein